MPTFSMFLSAEYGYSHERGSYPTTTADGVFVNHVFGGKSVSASAHDVVYIRACASPSVDTTVQYAYVITSNTLSFTVRTMAQAPYPPPALPSPPPFPSPPLPSPPRPPPPAPLETQINLGDARSVEEGGCVQITFSPYADYGITTEGVNFDVAMTGRSSWPGETFIADQGFSGSLKNSGFWDPEIFSSSSFYQGTAYTFINAANVIIGAQFCAGVSPTNINGERFYEFQMMFSEYGTSTTYQSSWLRLNLPYLQAPSSVDQAA